MNLCCMAFWKALRVSWTVVPRCTSIIVFSTSVQTPAQDAGQQVVAEHQRLRGDGDAGSCTVAA